jgi:hypothetical protein
MILPVSPAVQPVTRADVEAAFDIMEKSSLHAANLLRNYMRALESRLEVLEGELDTAREELVQLRLDRMTGDED